MIDPITQYILNEAPGWPDTYYGYKFQDACDGNSGYNIQKCRSKYKRGSKEESLCSMMASIIANKKYLKWINKRGIKICKDKQCISFAKKEASRMTNIINGEIKKLHIIKSK